MLTEKHLRSPESLYADGGASLPLISTDLTNTCSTSILASSSIIVVFRASLDSGTDILAKGLPVLQPWCTNEKILTAIVLQLEGGSEVQN